jgi:hypothetical protein
LFGAARTIAEWLWGSLNLQISPQELQLIEIVTREVQAAIDAGTALIRADLAQTQAALDTIQAQTKAPRPSRRVVLWGLRQINGIPGGVISAEAVEHLQSLLHAFGL